MMYYMYSQNENGKVMEMRQTPNMKNKQKVKPTKLEWHGIFCLLRFHFKAQIKIKWSYAILFSSIIHVFCIMELQVIVSLSF